MAFYLIAQGFVEITKEALKIFFRNGKLMPSITLLFLIFTTTLFFLNYFSLKPLCSDFAIKLFLIISGSSPDSMKYIIPMIEDLRLIFLGEWIFILITYLITFFFTISTILASTMIYGREKSLHIKELFSRLSKSLKSTFVTFFYTSLLNSGYSSFVFFYILPMVLSFDSKFTIKALSITIFIIAEVFRFYLAVVWSLAFVVSVNEDICGIEALWKAKQLVKGLKLKGFVLKLVFGTLYYVMYVIFVMVNNSMKLSPTMVSINLLVFLNCHTVVKVFSDVAYTVFYFECKKSCGEEVLAMIRETEYTKLSTESSDVAADIP